MWNENTCVCTSLIIFFIMMTPTGLDTCGGTSDSSHMHCSAIYHVYLMAAGLEKFSLYGNYYRWVEWN